MSEGSAEEEVFQDRKEVSRDKSSIEDIIGLYLLGRKRKKKKNKSIDIPTLFLTQTYYRGRR